MIWSVATILFTFRTFINGWMNRILSCGQIEFSYNISISLMSNMNKLINTSADTDRSLRPEFRRKKKLAARKLEMIIASFKVRSQ